MNIYFFYDCVMYHKCKSKASNYIRYSFYIETNPLDILEVILNISLVQVLTKHVDYE